MTPKITEIGKNGETSPFSNNVKSIINKTKWLNMRSSNLAANEISKWRKRGLNAKERVLTGQNVVKTIISPLGSISCLAARHPITIDLAGSHDFAWNLTLWN